VVSRIVPIITFVLRDSEPVCVSTSTAYAVCPPAAHNAMLGNTSLSARSSVTLASARKMPFSLPSTALSIRFGVADRGG